jgi:hypothetical protein
MNEGRDYRCVFFLKCEYYVEQFDEQATMTNLIALSSRPDILPLFPKGQVL